MRKTLLRLLAVTIAASGLAACVSEPMTTQEATRWIAAYTPEQIDMASRIRIEATDSLLAQLDTLCPLENVFRFSPSIQGEAVYAQGGRHLEFRPRPGALKPGESYRCHLDMAALTGIDTLKEFAFEFQVARREVKFKEVRVRIDPTDGGMVQIEGILKFSFQPGSLSPDNSRLNCRGQRAVSQIQPTADARQYTFRISEVQRQEKDSELEIEYDGATEGCDKIATKVVIPGQTEFKLLGVERHQTVQPCLELEFSAPLDAMQELDGLVTIDGIESLRIERSGNRVRIFYPNNGLRDLALRLSELIRAEDGRRLQTEVVQHLEQEVLPPAVEIPINGTILPDSRNLSLPFRAVNLAAVDVEVVKIYADNVLTFLQESEMEETYELRRVGRLIYRQTVRLDKDPSLDLHQWQNFSVDLNHLFRQERGAIYNIRLSFRQAYSLYDRVQVAPFEVQNGLTLSDEETWDKPCAYIGRRAPDYDWGKYEWRESDDPTKESYYMSTAHMPEYNLAASNLGLIVKRADSDRLWCTVSDIMTASPLAGIRVTAYNFQLREIGSTCTDEQGFADFRTDGNPFVITASDGVSTTFLKINGASELSTSRFDVGGKKTLQGIKGFIYGERGVWRPGDEIYLTLIVEDKQHALPANHPVTMELHTPGEQLYDRQTLTRSVDGIYAFRTKTAEDAPTGQWDARFKVGGLTFHHTVRIETIKPNRLKIHISSPEILRGASDAEIGLDARWLTSPVAAGLRASVEMSLFTDPHPFERYDDYRFANPLYAFSSSSHELLSGRLDSLGQITKQIRIPATQQAPGVLQANLIARVAEAGGDESITSRSVRYSPYEAYVGIRLGDREFETDCDLHFPVIAVDPDGKPLDSRELEYKIYRLDWSWWQEGSAAELSRYVQSESARPVASGRLKTSAGKAEIPFRIDYPAWGKYLAFVRDIGSGHASGGEIYIDWPDWRGHSGKSDPTAATMLSFALDKRNYEVGDRATVYLPRSSGGRVLLSVENGSRVLSRRWVRLSGKEETAYKLQVTQDMAPNFYVHATLLQPHAQTVNDLPIRMYGVEGAEVIDRRTILHPQIEVADEILPQRDFAIRIHERDNKPMSYTLAIVDEGLLDITAFRTPQPWQAMNRREALGVRTWDMFDDVIGAYAGKFTPILSVGGDEAIREAAGKEKRFNPVVKFLGPFTLNGGTKTHRITLPMYVGSVRVMVVAAHAGSYGSTDKTVTVRSPLMLLPTLPRMLACGDRVRLPVNLFASDKALGDIQVNIETEGPVSVVGGRARTLHFASAGEKMVDFELLCDRQKSGQAKIRISARDGGHSVNETLAIEVRNPQPLVTTVESRSVRSGVIDRFSWRGLEDGSVRMEIATIPSIPFSGAFAFVTDYGHFCTEQLSARAMYLLYARRFLLESEQRLAEETLPDILKNILLRQLPNGGFAYWPGYSDAHPWVTSMAGEVMVEARRQGFAIDRKAIDRWAAYQTTAARDYRHTTVCAADLVQAYRLYTLALAGDMPSAAMNRLRESRNLSRQALMRLAAAYALAGRGDVAAKLLEKADEALRISGNYETFYSPLRDLAMEVETWALLGEGNRAAAAARDLADKFAPTSCSTQEIAFTSVAMSRLADLMTPGSKEVVIRTSGGKAQTIRNMQGIEEVKLPAAAGSVTLENRGREAVCVSLTASRRPAVDEIITARADGVEISVRYTDLHGQGIEVAKLQQGQEFLARIEVRKRGNDSESMALTLAVPSGWEIWNERLINEAAAGDLKHLDIRDDRICWYFGLKAGETREFVVRLRAAWCGEFVLPATVCEDMYDTSCRAVLSNRRVKVVK